MAPPYMCLFFLLFACKTNVNCENITWDGMKLEYLKILDAFDNAASLRPVSFSENVLHVALDWSLVSIINFDESEGYLEVMGFLSFEWTAESLDASSAKPKSISTTMLTKRDSSKPSRTNITVLVEPTKIWRPPVILLNSLSGFELIGYDTSVHIRLNMMTKLCQWRPWIVARIACRADVQFYPYDRQDCSLRYSVWGYSNSEVTLGLNGNGEWGTSYFEENGEWDIVETSATTGVVEDRATASFHVVLSRRPMYYVIHIVIPIVLLGLVNIFTFLLPTDSGERIGYSVTCFLSYVVLLNIIMGLLPTTSSPMSYLSFYTFIMMTFSASMLVMTIVTVRVYHKPEDDEVPILMAVFYLLFTCGICKRSDANFVRKINLSIASIDEESVAPNSSIREKAKDVKWRNISRFMDLFCFYGFLAAETFYSISFLLPIFLNENN